jgi:hypothetical protein
MIRYLLSRLGCLILIAGGITLIVGIAAVRSDQPAFDVLLIGIGLSLLGFFLWNKLRRKVKRPSRSSFFRRRKTEKETEDEDNWKGWD